MLVLYSATVFLSAFLIFLVQPMIGKMILPLVGGAPAAWNSCLFFFQALMLAGYAYAHFSLRRLGLDRQALAHLALMLIALVLLPISFDRSVAVPEDPTFWLIIRLFKSAGLPFFVLAALSPLLQTWFGRTGHARAENPYFLFAASNLGSFAALLFYPTLIETSFGLPLQTKIWTGGFALLLILLVACRLYVKSAPKSDIADDRSANNKTEATAEPPVQPSAENRKLWPGWLVAALFPSALLLAVTQFITVEIAPIPLLWIIPLAIYLITYVMAFSRYNLPYRMNEILFVLAILLFPPAFFKLYSNLLIAIPLHLFILFSISLYCHSYLAATRPKAQDLTGYYMIMSFGSVIGSGLITFAAPLLFNSDAEYPLLIILTSYLAKRFSDQKPDNTPHEESLLLSCIMGIYAATVLVAADTVSFSRYLQQSAHALGFDPAAGKLKDLIYFIADQQTATASLMILLAAVMPIFILKKMPRLNLALFSLIYITGLAINFAGTTSLQLYSSRNFFGTKKVTLTPDNKNISLVHGSTIHGKQSLLLNRAFEPLAYFHRKGPIGSIFTQPFAEKADLKVAVIGLGIGSMLAYARPGQQFTFYEIDPEVINIAQNPDFFGYLSAFKDRCQIVCGDGRRMIEQASHDYYDVIFLDAFSSDSIPTHLLTREAITVYSQRLKANGSIIFQITNRYLDLKPMLVTLAEATGYHAVHVLDRVFEEKAPENADRNISEYVVFTRSPELFENLQLNTSLAWQSLKSVVSHENSQPIWTDDNSSLFPLLTFFY